MNPNETRTLWISVGAALFAIFLLYSWSQDQRESLSRRFGSSKRVVFASKDIAEMETLDESKLEIKELPVDFIQPDAVMDPEGAVGQVAAAPMKKGEQILSTKLLLPGPETGLSMEVSPQKRAITLPIDDVRGVARLLRPGDRIDIVAALDIGKGNDQRREVRTILQDVVVLATGLNVVNKIPRRFELDSNGKNINMINLNASTNFSNITIEAQPDEIQQLVYILATAPGSMFVTLRNPNDRLKTQSRVTSIEDILARTSRVPAAVAPPVPVVQPAPAPAPARQQPKRRGGFQDL